MNPASGRRASKTVKQKGTKGTMDGFGGTTLRINLATGEITRTPTDPTFAREWLGARGFVSKMLYDEVPRDADPGARRPPAAAGQTLSCSCCR